MSDRFSFVGQLKLSKAEEPISVRTFDSGWEISTLNMRIVSGNDTQFLKSEAAKWSDSAVTLNGKKNTIYTLKKAADGKGVEKCEVEWEQRNDEEVIKTIAGFKRFTIDMDITSPTDGSAGMKKQYLHASDFNAALVKILNNDNFKDAIYRVEGDINYTYSAKDGGTFYRDFVPTSVKRVASDTPQECVGRILLYFTDKNGDTMNGFYKALTVNEGADGAFKGYAKFYDRMSKKNGYAPYDIVIPEKLAKAAPQLFSTKDVSTLGITVRFFNGAQLVSANSSNIVLTEEQKTYLDLGIITMEEIIAEQSNAVYGDRVTKIVFTGLAKGYTSGPKAEETVTSTDLITPPVADQAASGSEIPTTIPKANLDAPSAADVFGDDFDIFKV